MFTRMHSAQTSPCSSTVVIHTDQRMICQGKCSNWPVRAKFVKIPPKGLGAYHVAMDRFLFAGIPVTDYDKALSWYETLLGGPPTFIPNDIEAVWDIAEGRSVYIALKPEHAGHGLITLFVDDFDELVGRIAARGLEPAQREQYDNGVRKAVYFDPDGNEFGIGG
jgi:catechol 2,3-dioxygenase-like lactoylglutathione lyase family enzyme